MSVSRSEMYEYIHNKAQHYHNIETVKPTFSTKLEQHYKTINYPQSKKNKFEPYMREYDIKVENKYLINRLTGISSSKRTEVQQTGYVRYNNFDRSFRKKNPHKEEVDRQIEIENKKIVNSLQHVKPLVGSTKHWSKKFGDIQTYGKISSRYDDGKSKSSLKIDKRHYILAPLRKFIGDGQSLNESGSNTSVAVLGTQRILKHPGSLQKSRSRSQISHSPGQQSARTLDPNAQEKKF